MSALCFLCGLFIELGASAHTQHSLQQSFDVQVADGRTMHVQPVSLYDIPRTRNPYGIVRFGYALPLARVVDLSLSAQHESSMSTGHDRGTNSISINVRWTPWRQP